MKRFYISYDPADGDVKAWHYFDHDAVDGYEATTGHKLTIVPEDMNEELHFLHHHYRVMDGKVVRKHPADIAAQELTRRPGEAQGPSEMAQMLEEMRGMRADMKQFPGQMVEKLERGTK